MAEYLRRYITSRGLGPGARLPGEAEISRELGISRPSVREASAALTAIGLISVGNGRRPCVGRLADGQGVGALRAVLEAALMTDQADLRQVMELRRGLEVEMAALAAERHRPEQLAALRDTLATMEGTIADRTAYAEADLRFHIQLGAASGNPLFALMVADAQNAVLSHLAIALRSGASPAELDRVQRLHEAILDAVAARDPGRARRAMTAHFNDVGRAMDRLEQEGTR